VNFHVQQISEIILQKHREQRPKPVHPIQPPVQPPPKPPTP
jgi:hypothetical protein